MRDQMRAWRAGVFRVEVHTFPPELQTLKTTNALHVQEPRLAIASSAKEQEVVKRALRRMYDNLAGRR